MLLTDNVAYDLVKELVKLIKYLRLGSVLYSYYGRSFIVGIKAMT